MRCDCQSTNCMFGWFVATTYGVRSVNKLLEKSSPSSSAATQMAKQTPTRSQGGLATITSVSKASSSNQPSSEFRSRRRSAVPRPASMFTRRGGIVGVTTTDDKLGPQPRNLLSQAPLASRRGIPCSRAASCRLAASARCGIGQTCNLMHIPANQVLGRQGRATPLGTTNQSMRQAVGRGLARAATPGWGSLPFLSIGPKQTRIAEQQAAARLQLKRTSEGISNVLELHQQSEFIAGSLSGE